MHHIVCITWIITHTRMVTAGWDHDQYKTCGSCHCCTCSLHVFTSSIGQAVPWYHFWPSLADFRHLLDISSTASFQFWLVCLSTVFWYPSILYIHVHVFIIMPINRLRYVFFNTSIKQHSSTEYIMFEFQIGPSCI